MPSQSHGQSDMRMGIVVAWQVANDHLLMLLKRQFHDIDHEIYAGLHDLEISAVDIQRETMSRGDILLVVGVLPVTKVEDDGCLARGRLSDQALGAVTQPCAADLEVIGVASLSSPRQQPQMLIGDRVDAEQVRFGDCNRGRERDRYEGLGETLLQGLCDGVVGLIESWLDPLLDDTPLAVHEGADALHGHAFGDLELGAALRPHLDVRAVLSTGGYLADLEAVGDWFEIRGPWIRPQSLSYGRTVNS